MNAANLLETEEYFEKMINTEIYIDRFTINLKDIGWTLGPFKKSVNTLGVCNNGNKTISLSKPFTLAFGLEIMKDVILHELAHAIEFIIFGTSSHGKIWKSIALQLGHSDPTRLLDIDLNDPRALSLYKYVAVCEKHGPVGGYTKKVKRTCLCGYCHKELKIYATDEYKTIIS